MNIQLFTFNPFQENTYILSDETKECIIIDPGCKEETEEQQIFTFIKKNNLQPVAIVNTHNHIDHVFGINAVRNKYNIPFYCHKGEVAGLRNVPDYAPQFGMNVAAIRDPDKTIDEESKITFGETTLSCRFTPGHSPASLCFIHEESKSVIGGDVLFQGSIGRTDLPGGDYKTLMESIENELLTLGDNYRVYPGHGPRTTIGIERKQNPFIREYAQAKQ